MCYAVGRRRESVSNFRDNPRSLTGSSTAASESCSLFLTVQIRSDSECAVVTIIVGTVCVCLKMYSFPMISGRKYRITKNRWFS